jgi:S-DNA-T family DNA segregation ATPase FtsK/SpoIIIE
MEKRLKMFAKACVRNIEDFNSRGSVPQDYIFDDESLGEFDESLPKGVPYIVIVIDDFSGLMKNVREKIEKDITLLTGRARSAGIHLVLVTQRSDADVLPGTILANVPGRIAFKTTSSSDSKSILDNTGAEDLIGKGDCLFRRKNGICRAQAPYIGDAEIEAVIAEAKRKWGDKCSE